MLHINSENLSVSLLDPREDGGKMGSRYCTGCYIWQVRDADGRSLLSGPCFPSENPPVFDGQGMPEVFETPLGGGGEPVGAQVCVMGVGLVKKTSGIEPFHARNNPLVTQPCIWEIEQSAGRAAMTTKQSYRDKSIELKREVRVDGKQIESLSRAANTGSADVTLRWFSHPFFPLNPDFSCGKICPGAVLPESAGYRTDSGGAIFMKPDYPWEKGLFQTLEIPDAKLSFSIPHPVVGRVTIQTDYNVIRCALWANAHTFSFEPFMQRVLKSGETADWQISVSFGD